MRSRYALRQPILQQQAVGQGDAAAGGAITVLFAAVELPDGARIKQIAFFGADTDPAENIVIQLYRSNFNIPTVVGLLSAPDSPESASIATRWAALNHVRHALVLAAWIAALQTFALFQRQHE